MEMKKMLLMECHLAGRLYHDADEVWDLLRVGTRLSLVRDADNRFDPNAIAVGFPLGDGEDDVIIGYVPAARNEVLAKFLDMG